MHGRLASSALGSAAFLLVCACAVPSFGQTDEQRAGARSLATEGASAFSDGRYKDAVDLFSKAESLVHAPPHLLFMARAHAKLGQLVKAREAYLKITKEQLAPNAPQAFRDAQAAAPRELAAIDPKIGSLSVKIEGAEAAKDLQLKVDGVPIPAVLIGVPSPIDPGDHKIEAVATGFRAQPRLLKIGEGEKTSTSLRLEVDPNAVAAAPAVNSTGEIGAPPAPINSASAGGSTSSLPQADTGTTGGPGGMRIAAYSAFGVGALGLGLGTVFLLKSSSKRSDADNLCTLPGGACDVRNKAAIEQADSDADSARTLAVVGFVLGGAGAAAGALLLVLDKGSDTKGASIRPWIGLGSAGISGRF